MQICQACKHSSELAFERSRFPIDVVVHVVVYRTSCHDPGALDHFVSGAFGTLVPQVVALGRCRKLLEDTPREVRYALRPGGGGCFGVIRAERGLVPGADDDKLLRWDTFVHERVRGS